MWAEQGFDGIAARPSCLRLRERPGDGKPPLRREDGAGLSIWSKWRLWIAAGAVLTVLPGLVLAAPASPAKSSGGDKVSGHGQSGPVISQPVPSRPFRPGAAAAVAGGKNETVKQLQAPTTVTFDVRPGETRIQPFLIAAGDLIVHLEPDPYGDGVGEMVLLAPGNVSLCQGAVDACAVHVVESARYVLVVRNLGRAAGTFSMVFSLPRSLPALGNRSKPRPR